LDLTEEGKVKVVRVGVLSVAQIQKVLGKGFEVVMAD
jgi:predicted transcriptional regulator